MQAVMNGYKGISLLFWLNSDRLFTVGTIIVGLLHPGVCCLENRIKPRPSF